MKYARAIFYLLMVISLIAGLYSGLRVFFVLFISGLSIVILLLLLNIYTIYTFKYSQDITQHICEAQEIPELHLSLFNENFFPLSILVIHIQVVSMTEKVNLTFSLPPFSRKDFQMPLHLPYCGVYKVGMTKIRIYDVFDLVPFYFDMRYLSYYRLKEIIVLPKAYALGAIPGEVTDAKAFAQRQIKLAEQGENYSDARLYRKGDSIKRIHWKKSAQHNTLYVKQYDLPEMEAITLLIDSSRLYSTALDQKTHAHTLCESAATIALRALRQKRAVRLIFSEYPKNTLLCTSSDQFDELRHALALHNFSSLSEHFFSSIKDIDGQIGSDQEIYLLSGQSSTAFMSEIEAYARKIKHFLLIHIDGQPDQGHLRKICVPKGGDVALCLTTGAVQND